MQEGIQNMEEKRYYVFECRCDRFRFVLVFQVLVGHLKDILLLFPFLFILCHVTWGEDTNQLGYLHGSFNFYTMQHLCLCQTLTPWVSHNTSTGTGAFVYMNK